MNLGYLGPRGTYSDMAAQYFLETLQSHGMKETVAFKSFVPILDALEVGELDAAVLPLENMIEGSVLVILDRLAISPLQIRAEAVLSIRHAVFGIDGTVNEEVRQVLSHPQALAQSRQTLLGLFPQADHVDVDSTAKGVVDVVRRADPHVVCVASFDAGRDAGLTLLHADAQDVPGNVTRFALITRDDDTALADGVHACGAGQPYKTSLLLALGDDHAGALVDVLSVFARYRVNLTKLESRPTRRGLGSYHFYIDCTGRDDDLAISRSLDEIRAISGFSVRDLGSYPCFTID